MRCAVSPTLCVCACGSGEIDLHPCQIAERELLVEEVSFGGVEEWIAREKESRAFGRDLEATKNLSKVYFRPGATARA